MQNQTIHELKAELNRWRVLALVSIALFVAVAVWSAIERVCQ